MASYNTIRALIQKAVGGNLSSDEIDKLAKAITRSASSDAGPSSTGDAEKSVERAKQELELANALGRTAAAREANIELAKAEYNLAVQNITAKVRQGEAVGKELEALQLAEQRYLKLKAAQDAAGNSAQVFAGIIENSAQSLFNLGKTGLTTAGVFQDIMNAVDDLKGSQDKYKTSAQQAAEQAEKENEQRQKHLETLKKKAETDGDAIELQGQLAEAEAAAAESAEVLAQAQQNLGQETGKASKATGNLKIALTKIASSDIGKGFINQFDPINIAFSRVQQVFEQAKNIQNESFALFQETGLVVGDAAGEADRYRMSLTSLALESKSLSVESKELNNAVASLQANFTQFDQTKTGLIETFAILEQAGMSAQVATENFAFFRQALGKSDAEAEQLTLNMMSLANELKRPPSEIAAAFQQGSKSLASYGNNFVKVQEKMIRVATKLGIQVDKLVGSFDSMDTIEGAAKVAGDINAILGAELGEGLNSIALANAELPDKILMVRDTILKLDPTGAQLDNRKIAKQLAESTGLEVDVLRKLLQDREMSRKDLEKVLKGDKQAETLTKEKLGERVFSQLTAEQKGKLESEKLTMGLQEEAGGLMDFIAENQTAFTAIASGLSVAGSIFGGMFTRGGGLGSALVKGGAAAMGGDDGEGGGVGGILGGAGANMMGDCVRICNDSMLGLGQQLNPGGVVPASGDDILELGNTVQQSSQAQTRSFRAGLNAMAGRASGGFLTQGAGTALGGGGMGGILGAAGAAAAVVGAGAAGVMIGKSIYEAFNEEKATSFEGLRSTDLTSAFESTAEARGQGANEARKQASKMESGIDWENSSLTMKYNYCANNDQKKPAGQPGPVCGVVNREYFKEKRKKELGKVNDFISASSYKREINANSSDEIIGVKEGGLIARKLDKLIELMKSSGGKDIVLQLDRKEIARSVVSTVNNDFYNIGT